MSRSRTFPLLLIAGFSLFSFSAIQAQRKKVTSPAYEKYIDDNFAAHLKEYQELVAIPSISSIPAHAGDVARAAEWIQQKMKAIGLSVAEIIPTGGHPAVFGAWTNAPGKPTVLIYAHYDVQPVKESEWIHPPFTPTIEGDKIFGRGASDDKSGVMNALWAAEALLKTEGRLPVNLKFIFEGEEEEGSPHFKELLEKNKDLLKADYLLNADDGQFDEQTPAMTVSLRGAVPLEFSIKTADVDGHSGEFGGKTPNAAMIMADILHSFHDEKGNVAVEGFYDKVIPISNEQRAMIKKVPYDPADDMKILGTTAETGDTSYSPLERIWYRPTLEIVGMESGYTAPDGHSNIIPGHAMARITCRLVNNQNGPEIVDLIIKHIKKVCPPGATPSFKFSGAYASPFQVPTNTKEYEYIATVLTGLYGKPPLQLATGGSVGAMLSFKEVLGLYAYPLGFQLKDEQWHASNEFFRLSSMRKGQLAFCRYLSLVGKENSKVK